MIKHLEWDSNFFGYKIGLCLGKFSKKGGYEKFVKEFKKDNYDCVYIFYGQKQVLPKQLKNKRNVLSVGGHAEYELIKKNWRYKQFDSLSDVVIFDNKHKIPAGFLKDIKLISRQLAPISRFYYDPRFKPRVKKMYEIWADKIIKDKKGFTAVCLKNNQVAALISSQLKDGIGKIALVKTGKKFEGRGIASKLLYSSIKKLFASGAKKIIVVTQADNLAAKGLYQSAGFKIKKITRIYHYWKF